jgi:IS5 family transposase
MGVQDVAFHKKRALTIDTMVKSRWVYCKLKNFRAGIEANISCLKRAFGLTRCTWRGLDHFKAYVWSSVVAHNLALLVRLKPSIPDPFKLQQPPSLGRSLSVALLVKRFCRP